MKPAPPPFSPAMLPTAEPVVIGRCAGWLHRGGAHGILMCGAYGFEGLTTRLSWHILADTLARRGFTVLRFDYPGTGDSLDPAPGETRPAAAIDATRAAAAWLGQRQGIDTLSCVSLRLGALIAAEALGPEHRVARSVFLAPVMNGRAHVREAKIAAKLFSDAHLQTAPTDGSIDLCGHVMTSADIADLSARSARPLAGAQTLLVVPPDHAAPAFDAAASEHMVERLEFAGYDALMRDPGHSTTPFAVFDAVADWLARPLPPVASEARSAVPGTGSTEPAVLDGPHFSERRLLFGDHGHLAGVLCEPSGPDCGASVIMFNAGANSHEGWARMNVAHARALAADGIASLRMDLSGIGDSAWYREGPRPHLYSARHVMDALTAVDAMARQGHGAPLLTGPCAGGFVAFQAAARDTRIKGIVVVNALRLIWTDMDDLDAYERDHLQSMTVYKDHLRSGRALRRLISGDIPLQRLAQITGRLAQIGMQKAADRLGLHKAGSVAVESVRAQLAAMARRGVRATFVHSDLDLSVDESTRHFGSGFSYAKKWPGIAFETIPGADHELTPPAARARYLDIIRQQARAISPSCLPRYTA